MEIDKSNPFADDLNPFDNSNELDNSTNTNDTTNSANTNTKSSNNKNLHFDNHLTTHELSDNDSIMATPNIGTALNESGTFDDIELENDNNEAHEMKRLRMGTQRNKFGRNKVGRAKTLKWAKKNFHNPFEDLLKEEDAFDDAGLTNRADELRTVYHNMPLPADMLDETGKPLAVYARNKIRTTKYTPLTFLPKNIMYQFQNFANVYFLILIILGAFQIFGVTNPGLSAVPLIVIVIITAIKDAIEDSRRTVLDLQVNNTKTHILTGVTNENVSTDNVSLWRKFKKANTRLLFKFIEICKEHFTEEGRRKLAMRKRNQLRAQRVAATGGGVDMPRGSFDSLGSYRFSAEFGRPSLDYNNMDETDNYDEGHIIDTSLPVRDDTKFTKDFWKNVKVGDIVRIHNNDEIPADIILLSTSDSDGACYIETKNLDGETNLKVRQSLKVTLDIKSSRDIARTKFWVESEGPHANLYSYQGNLKYVDTKDGDLKNEPITINNLLLRGCTLRNTKWAMGMVIFTGDETKIMLNSGVTPTKKSKISRQLNLSVSINFLILFILCFISAVINGVYYQKSPVSRDFFEFGSIGGSPATNGFISFWVSVILYQSLVPISLYISVEIIKTAQAAFIYGDVLLYNAKLDYPCTPKTWNISDDLGQIEYIFSDKTGTLTQNVMEFKKCTINGVSYGRAYTEALAGLRKRQGVDVESESRREKEGIKRDREIMIKKLLDLSSNSQFYPEDITFVSKEFVEDLAGAHGEEQRNCCQHFMLALALCHSVLTEKNKLDPNKLDLKAQSPDEAALVTTARDMGFSFLGKTKTGMIVEIQGIQKEFQILNILEFNSSRKRMSCIVKIPGLNPDDEPKALLICKGADSIIYSRLSTKAGANNETLLEKTALHLEQYATEGLRTLCIAQKEISWSDYQRWNDKYNVAAAALTNREEQLDAVADEIERDLILLGGTAIEDRLQDGVPDSIALLAKAGIKLWVLTGDKVETAINIGFSCNLLNNDMELLVVKTSGDDVKEFGDDPAIVVESLICKYLREHFGLSGNDQELAEARKDHEHPRGNFAVIIDGEALKLALQNDEIRKKFLLLCKNCRAVLCCRVSPSQKAAVVKLVKNTLDVMTLAIGDGSNDVAMIQSADVGVGIAGEEGRQAVMCSDYAIGQFRYLARLLLVHGRWSYKRLAEMIPAFFYKNVIFTLALFWYGIYNNFDGSYLFEYTFLMFYNLAFTSLPVIFLGILDQDVSDTVSLVVPELYRAGILGLEWKQTKFLWYMFDGLYQSCISFFFPSEVYRRSLIVTRNGLGLDHRYEVGIMVASIAVLSCNLYILLHQYRWDWFSALWIVLSCLFLFFWTGVWSSSLLSKDLFKAGSRIYQSPSFWCVLFIGIFYCLVPRFTYDCLRKFFYPTDVEIVREMWARGDFDHYPPGYDPTDPARPRIVKPGKFGEYPVSGIMLSDNYGEDNLSQNSVVTEEIPMNIMNNPLGSPEIRRVSENKDWMTSPKETQDLLFSPVIDSDDNNNNNNINTGRFETSNQQNGSNLRYSNSMNNRDTRTSLDFTREHMLANHELDNRYSVDRARISLDLPGITNAENLLEGRKSFAKER